MRAILNRIRDEAVFDEAACLSAVLLYDNSNHAKVAKDLFDRLCLRLPEKPTLRLNPWAFDSLSDPRAQTAAELDAASADLIIVSAGGNEPLPHAVTGTLEKWLSREGAAGFGLITLLADVRERDIVESPVHRYIDALSARAGCESFSCGLRVEREPIRCTMENQFNARVASQEFLATSSPGRRWGIND